MIAALNGPTTVHSEYVLLADIVIATPDTVFQDKPHFAFGIVPGDGIHSLWPEVIGSIRGRTFVLTQQILAAEEAKALGVISEIVPRDRLLDRAREIAGRIAQLPPLTASYTRVALTQKLRHTYRSPRKAPSHRSCHLLLKATRGVTIALVSSRERKRRQPGLATDDPAFVGWHQLVRGIQGS